MITLQILLSGKKRKYLYFDFNASLKKWLALQAKMELPHR